MKFDGPLILNDKAIAAMHESYEETAKRMAGWLDRPTRAELNAKYGYDEPASDEDELNELFPREA